MRTKTSDNELTLEFPSRSSNEGFARSAVACFAAQMDPTLNELEDIKTAVSEAVTNAIVHAYPDSIGQVVVKVRICPDQVLEVTVRDHGRGIPVDYNPKEERYNWELVFCELYAGGKYNNDSGESYEFPGPHRPGPLLHPVRLGIYGCGHPPGRLPLHPAF